MRPGNPIKGKAAHLGREVGTDGVQTGGGGNVCKDPAGGGIWVLELECPGSIYLDAGGLPAWSGTLVCLCKLCTVMMSMQSDVIVLQHV